MRHGFKAKSEREATNLRDSLGLQARAPLYAKKLAKHMGIRVITPSYVHGLTQEHFDQLCGRGSSDWSAVTLFPLDLTLIIHNPSHSDGRQESDIVHELGHLICKHQPSEILQINGIAFPIRTCNPVEEEEADWVCGCLKLPRDGLLWAVRNGMEHDAIAAHFAASRELVSYRIRITGVEQQVQRERKKWKRK